MTALPEFVADAVSRRPALAPLVACFYAVRDLPYALDGANDAAGLLRQGRGDCLAKSELMKLIAESLGVPARFVRWRYLIPAVVPEVTELPDRLDVHRAVQVRPGPKWLLADVTHQSGLRGRGLIVADWDGQHDTVPCYPVVGPMMIDDNDPAAVAQACAEVARWTARCPPAVLQRWRSAYIAWLRLHE